MSKKPVKKTVPVKRFKVWHKLKVKIHNSSALPAGYKERDIWWVSLGTNIGVEEDGKGSNFGRPVLIVKGFNTYLFWGVPLSTTAKTGKYYHQFMVNGKVSTALLSQLRTYDTRRLINKYGMIGLKDFGEIRKQLRDYIK